MIHPVIGFEDLLQQRLRQAGALVDKVEDHHLGTLLGFGIIHDDDPQPLAILDGVVHQIADAAFECQRLAAVGLLAASLYGDALLSAEVVAFGNHLQ